MDFISNGHNNPFQIFENVETPKAEKVELNLPLFGTIDISPWASGVSSSGVPITKDTTKPEESALIINNSPEEDIQGIQEFVSQNTTSQNNKIKNGSKEAAKKFFIEKGLSPHQAAGIVGNLIQESNLNTSIKGDGGKSFGIAQWNGDRRKGLQNFAKERGTDISDLNTQLEYVWKELNSTHKNALDEILQSKNSDEATVAFMRKFEKPNEKYANLAARLRYAKSCLS